jgi:hypothetical protein
MERCLSLLVVWLALVGSVCRAGGETWRADNGNGTYSNPLFYEEFSDPSMIRVGPDFYLTGTTMHCMPGLPIPVDKTITLTSLADGAVLAAQDAALAAVTADDPAAFSPAARRRVVDRGQGRVALQAASGNFVSVATPGKAGSVSLKTGEPGPSETFQWVDMQRGDIMLLSLATHRYLLAAPDAPGPVSADHAGARPDRKDGACLAWKE